MPLGIVLCMISLTLLLATTLAISPQISPNIAREIALMISRGDPAWNHASLGAYAVNTATGETVFDENAEKSLIPASCMKVVTTAAALQILGPDTRFTTHLEYDGTVEHGILHGNLYIHGGGDPCLGSDRIEGVLSWEKQIEAWVDAVQKLGIKQIDGKVIGDASGWKKRLLRRAGAGKI